MSWVGEETTCLFVPSSLINIHIYSVCLKHVPNKIRRGLRKLPHYSLGHFLLFRVTCKVHAF